MGSVLYSIKLSATSYQKLCLDFITVFNNVCVMVTVSLLVSHKTLATNKVSIQPGDCRWPLNLPHLFVWVMVCMC